MMGVLSRFSSAKLSPQHHPDPQEDLRDTDIFPCENGIELVEEFVPVEYPIEPVESDRPVQCPQPEPCIIHDNVTWKEKQQKENEQGLRYLQQNLIYEMQPKQCMVPHMPLSPPPKIPQRGNTNCCQ